MAKTHPPVKGGKVIGSPYKGTHDRKFNKRGGSDNWESENAVDIAVPVGTPVYAVTDGVIGPQFGYLPGSGSGRFAGQRLHLVAGKREFYYAHLSAFASGIRPGTHVKAGQLLGYSGEANGVAHLHFATTTNTNPLAWAKGMGNTPETATKLPGINENTTGENTTEMGTVPDQTQQNLIAGIGAIGGFSPAGAPTASAPLIDDEPQDFTMNPLGQNASTWQLIAGQGNVSQDTLRLAQMASLAGGNG